MHVLPKDIILLTSICCSERYQPLTIDMRKGKYTGLQFIRLSSIVVPDSSPFYYIPNKKLSGCN